MVVAIVVTVETVDAVALLVDPFVLAVSELPLFVAKYTPPPIAKSATTAMAAKSGQRVFADPETGAKISGSVGGGGGGELGGGGNADVAAVVMTVGGATIASAAVAVAPPIAAPHDVQNAMPAPTLVPHDPQKRGADSDVDAGGRAAPQLTQKPAPSGIFVPHDEQFIVVSIPLLEFLPLRRLQSRTAVRNAKSVTRDSCSRPIARKRKAPLP